MNISSSRNFQFFFLVIRVESDETEVLQKGTYNEGDTMLNTPAFVLLALYSAIIVISYLVVRRGWLRAYPVFVVGGVANAFVIFAFSLLRGNMLLQAVIVGPLMGFLFAALSVIIATLYRDTAPAKAAKPALVVSMRSENPSLEQAHRTAA